VSVLDVKARHEARLLAIPGVVGVAADLARNRIIVYVETEEDAAKVPSEIEGFPVEVRVVGKVVPLG